ncbi:hypothetical protein LMIY3S_05600 [Labrys miyagiensis]
MRQLGYLVIAALLCPALAHAEEVLVRTRLDPTDKAVIGQPVDLVVEVLFAGEMPHPPNVSVADAPGAQILRFETQAVTTREQSGDTIYVGQRFTFEVFPRRGGALTVPAPQVTLLDRGGDPVGTAQGTAQHLQVEVPSGLDASGPVLAANEVTLTQNWTPAPGAGGLRPGAALVRTIQRKADGAPAFGMADFSFTAPPGVRIYVDPPQSDDHVTRGSVNGARTDRVTYVFEKPGSYDLPSLVQSWWDLQGHKVGQLTAGGVHVDVSAPPPAGAKQRPGIRTAPIMAAAIAGVLVLAGALAWLVLARRGRNKSGAVPEGWARREVWRAASGGDARQTYEALQGWLQCLPAEVRMAARRDAALGPAIDQLEAFLFGGASAWDSAQGGRLAGSVRAFASQGSHGAASRAILPPLNAGRDPL